MISSPDSDSKGDALVSRGVIGIWRRKRVPTVPGAHCATGASRGQEKA